MRVTRVELQNIKSYRSAVINLQRGVTAIRGHNGSGKSTLVEAIGWALFDTLPYKQDQFVREGEKFGKVTVRFVSPRDDREYEAVRRCGNGANWYILDPETGTRYETSVDIHDFLRAQFQVDSSVSLKDLYDSAIGVPQGALTADFLLKSAPRKARFDTLLQVEEYATATSKLLETVNYLKRQVVVCEAGIEALEREVAELDTKRERLARAREEVAGLEAARETLEREAEVVETRRGALLQAQTALARAEGDARAATERLDAARKRLSQTETLLAEARAAAETIKATRADHDRYLRAEREEAAARARQRERDILRQREADAARRHSAVEAEERHMRQRLAGVESAEREMAALIGAVNQQNELERVRDEARQNAEKLVDVGERAGQIATMLSTLAQAIAAREREVTRIEAARPEAGARDERRRLVEDLQAAAAVRQQHETRRVAILAERQENAKRRQEAEADGAKQQGFITRIEAVRADVERLPALEREEAAAKAALDAAVARLAQTRQSREQAGAGNCPFLAEPCLNIQKRGENSLRGYFDKRIAQEERAIEPLKAALEAAAEAAKDARTKQQFYDRLKDYRDRLAMAQAALVNCDATAKRLDLEEAEITAGLKRATDAAALAKARQALKASEDADRLVATLASVQRDLEDKRAQQNQLTGQRDDLQALAASLAAAPDAQREAEAALVALGDPRKTVTGLSARAAERPALQKALETATQALAKLAAERAEIGAALAPHATLDAELDTIERTLGATRDGHTRYIQHERTASLFDARAKDHTVAAADSATAEAASATARQALAAAQLAFDAGELERVTRRAAELSDARGANRHAIRTARDEITRLEAELERGRERIAALEAARVERDEMKAMEQTLQQFRDTLREAGPLVTRALLSQISVQANAIFGDIMGDRAGVLAWENDYEITLRRGDSVRTFAQLSGGEQMTAALAVRLALLRRLTRLDMAFFDEPTQNMDGERRTALAEQLRRVRGFDQLIVISHDDTFEQGLDSVIHLEKRDGATCVAEGEDVYTTESPLAGDLSALAL